MKVNLDKKALHVQIKWDGSDSTLTFLIEPFDHPVPPPLVPGFRTGDEGGAYSFALLSVKGGFNWCEGRLEMNVGIERWAHQDRYQHGLGQIQLLHSFPRWLLARIWAPRFDWLLAFRSIGWGGEGITLFIKVLRPGWGGVRGIRKK